jgi:hypothetical protein
MACVYSTPVLQATVRASGAPRIALRVGEGIIGVFWGTKVVLHLAGGFSRWDTRSAEVCRRRRPRGRSASLSSSGVWGSSLWECDCGFVLVGLTPELFILAVSGRP